MLAQLDAVPKATLIYPLEPYQESFPLLHPLKDGYDPVTDLVKTATLIGIDFPEFGDPLDSHDDGICREMERAARKKDYDKLLLLVDDWNKTINEIRTKGAFHSKRLKPLDHPQSQILLEQLYARCVTDPESLNRYEGN